jgi:hypothetical protein
MCAADASAYTAKVRRNTRVVYGSLRAPKTAPANLHLEHTAGALLVAHVGPGML